MRRPLFSFWKRSNLQTGLTVLWMLTPLVFVSLTPAQAIFNGVERSDEESRSVPAVGEWTPGYPCSGNGCVDEPGYVKRLATSNVISYRGIDQRCLLTARHAAPWDKESENVYPRVVMQADVDPIFNYDRDQLVADTYGLLPKGGSDAAGKPSPATYRDLRVNWVENRLDDPDNGDVRIHLSDYVAKPIRKVDLDDLRDRMDDEDKTRPFYDISGYGHSYDHRFREDKKMKHKPRGWGILRSGKSSVREVSEEPNGGGARMSTRSVLNANNKKLLDWELKNAECLGDSGAAALFEDGKVFSGVSFGNVAHCDAENRADFRDPNPDPNANKRKRGGQEELNGEFVLHTLLNSTGRGISNPPEETPWEEVGNWEQVVYRINDICTKDMSFDISGLGFIVGYVDRPLEEYGTVRLNKEITCFGSADRLVSGTGDCFEAVHQPEDLIVAAVGAPGWKFLQWSNGPYEIDPDTNTAGYCPCIEKDPKDPDCKILFDEIGHYTADGSYDLSYCMAEFVEEPVVNDEMGGGGLGGF